MSLLEKIQKLAKEKGLTIKQIERECGLANATIRRWDKQNPSLESVLKVSQYLNVSIDFLVGLSSSSTIEHVISCDGVPLSESEADLLAMYRLLDKRDKQTVFELTKLKYELMTGEKASAFSTYTDTTETQKSAPGDGGKAAGGNA